MSFIELLRIIRSNLIRMKLRVLMTSAGVFIGTLAVVLLISIGNGLQRVTQASIGDIGELTQIEVSPGFGGGFGGGTSRQEEAKLTDTKLSEFRQLPGVVAVSPVTRLQASGQLEINRLSSWANVQGYVASDVDKFEWKTDQGSTRLARGQVLVGSQIGENFYNERTGRGSDEPLDLYGKTLELVLTKFNSDGSSTEKRVRMRVSGVLTQSNSERDYSIIMPASEVQTLNQWATGQRTNTRRDGHQQVIVKAGSTREAGVIEDIITAQGFQVFSMRQIMKQINQVFAGIQAAFGCIGGIALLVAAIGIANTMVMAIYERTREIGLMKAVGATNREVMLIFLGEAGSIGLIGGIAGVVAGWGIGRIAGIFALQYLQQQAGGDPGFDIPAPIYTPAWLIIFALVFSLVIGIISGIYPAIRATRLDPIAALKYE